MISMRFNLENVAILILIELFATFNQRHPKVTSGRMMGTELTLINPFVKFVRNVRKLRNFCRIPDGNAEWLLRW